MSSTEQAPAPFAARLDVLPAPQRQLWDELAAVPPEFVLYGGTAIALHLGHRESLDFDFLGDRSFDPDRLVQTVPFMTSATITQRAKDTISGVVDRGGSVKVSFFGVPGIRRLATPLRAMPTNLGIASLLDLAGTKASVVQVRAEAKDYIDIDALMTSGGISLPTALAAAKAIYGSMFNPQITLKALSYFDDGNLATLSAETRRRLIDAVRNVDLDRLPNIAVDAC